MPHTTRVRVSKTFPATLYLLFVSVPAGHREVHYICPAGETADIHNGSTMAECYCGGKLTKSVYTHQ